MASLKGSKGKKRCTKGKSCGASCIQMRKVCWKEMGDGVSSSTSKVRDLVQGGATTTKPKPVQKPTKKPTKVSTPQQQQYDKIPNKEMNERYWQKVLKKGEKGAKSDWEVEKFKNLQYVVEELWKFADSKGRINISDLTPRALKELHNLTGINPIELIAQHRGRFGHKAPFSAASVMYGMMDRGVYIPSELFS